MDLLLVLLLVLLFLLLLYVPYHVDVGGRDAPPRLIRSEYSDSRQRSADRSGSVLAVDRKSLRSRLAGREAGA